MVCGTSSSLNGEALETCSDILEAAIDSTGSREAISTEDLLADIDKVSPQHVDKNLQQDDIFAGSLDVKALYPSLDIEQTSKICGDRVKTSPLVFEGVNLKWALKYVALGLKDGEREQRHLEHLILGHKGKGNKKPMVRTVEKDESIERLIFPKELSSYSVIEKITGSGLSCRNSFKIYF